MTLAELRKGERARVLRVGGDEKSLLLVRSLLEMGVLEGSEIEVLHEAPVSQDPIAVLVRGGLLALRRQEANLVEVERLP